jgi:large subunit ribosomal protein L21
MVEIVGVGAKPKASKAAAKEEKPVEAAVVADAAPAAEAPSLKSMKKDELIAFAKEKGIEVDGKATKPVIIEAIEAQLK